MIPSIQHLDPRDFDPKVPSEEFRNQWKHPAGVFVVLLILGGDVIKRALAQLAGSWVTPVAFSFGWVSYAVTAVVSALGENKLMPPPDCGCRVINGQNGYVRDNSSWIIGRMMRDYDSWMDARIKTKLNSIIDDARAYDREEAIIKRRTADVIVPKSPKAGLCVSVYTARSASLGCPGYTRRYCMGVATILIQLGIAAIPWGLFGDWTFILITGCGNVLALATGMLSQGNGSQHAIVIRSQGKGLDLEDLATGPSDVYDSASWLTQASICVLGLLWILLLITAAGIARRTGFLLSIGALGILQNMIVAGFSRKPKDFGIPITYNTVIGYPKVMKTLFEVEQEYPRVGRSMRETFSPGILRDEETTRWKLLEERADALDKASKDQEAATCADAAATKAETDANSAQRDADAARTAVQSARNRQVEADQAKIQATMAAEEATAEVAKLEDSLSKIPAGDEAAKIDVLSNARWQAAKAKATKAEVARVDAVSRAEAAGAKVARAQRALVDRDAISRSANDEAITARSVAQAEATKAQVSKAAADQAQKLVDEAAANATAKEKGNAKERKKAVDAIVNKVKAADIV